MERTVRGFHPRDRAFIQELAYGVSRLRGRLDHLVGRRVHGGLGRLDPRILEVLRLGAYQILYMDGVPRYAAVSQSVSQAQNVSGKGAGGLVNAVLRGVAEDGAALRLFPAFETDPAAFLETWGSHPRWLVDRWLARWSPEEVRALVEANNRRPALYLVPLEATAEEARQLLADGGIGARVVGKGTECLHLRAGTNPSQALEALPSLIQDPAAHLVTRYADVAPGTKVADLCAAPGGKALALAARASYTLAADRSETRMRLVRENARRTGLPLGMVVADARRPPVVDAEAVLLDVPCTGTGTLGRHPDGRWRLETSAMEDMVKLQREILEAGAHAVRPGGLLIYSTCTLEPEENRAQVEAFLARHTEFRVEATEAVPGEYMDEEGFLELLPQTHGFDGAFAARLRRTK